MGDILLLLLTVLLGVLLVLLVLLLVLKAVQRRRRAVASRSLSVPMIDAMDGRRIVDTVFATRRTHGRHSAALPPPSGVMLLMLVPIAVKRRRQPLDVSPRFVSIQPDAVGDVVVAEDPAGYESDTAAIAAPRSVEASPQDHAPTASAAADVHTYRRRVDATIQAVSRRIGPGESPELVEARMLAAMDRLDGPVNFSRPRLSPSGPRRSTAQLGHTLQAAAPAGPAALPPQVLTPETPADDVFPEAEALEPEDVRPEGSAPDEAEVVLPVPPLPASDETRRRGLRRRGKAG